MYKLVATGDQKNMANKLIVVYHEDDKSGATFAKVLHEKGYDNIYLLEGGIESFYQQIPRLVEGLKLPALRSDLGR